MATLRRRPLLRAAAIGGGAYRVGKRGQEARERRRQKELAKEKAASETRARSR
jgi:hypothetical protein